MNRSNCLRPLALLLAGLLATSNGVAASGREAAAVDEPPPPPPPETVPTKPPPASKTAQKAATTASASDSTAVDGGGEPVDSHIEIEEETDSAMQPGGTAQTEDVGESPDPDERDVKAAQQELRVRRGALRGCYDKALKNDGSLRGTLTVRLAVALNGAFTEVSFPEGSLRSPIVTTCIRDQVLQWKMSPLKGPVGLSLDLPLTFKP